MPAKVSIDRLRYRVDAAAKDFYDLSLDMAARFKRYGDVIVIGQRPYPKGHGMYAVVARAMPMPIDWSRDIAHIVYDLRSTLDHLVLQLYVVSNGKHPRGKVAQQLMFPACQWKSDHKGRTQG